MEEGESGQGADNPTSENPDQQRVYQFELSQILQRVYVGAAHAQHIPFPGLVNI